MYLFSSLEPLPLKAGSTEKALVWLCSPKILHGNWDSDRLRRRIRLRTAERTFLSKIAYTYLSRVLDNGKRFWFREGNFVR
jgi:hypothetical protein